MRGFYVAILLLLSAGAAFGQRAKLDRLMDYYAVHDHFNGTVLVVRKGAILLSKSYGYGNEFSKAKNTESTMFLLGSNTCQFTAEMMVQLDSKGRLGLEDRLGKYLPGYPNGDRITLKNLLTHTSGIADFMRDSAFVRYSMGKALKREDVLARFRNSALAFAPGTNYEYSSSNYYLLGMVIEHITRKKYERELRENIFSVCGMSRSGIDWATRTDPYKAKGYYLAGNGKMTEAPVYDTALTFACNDIYSTAADLLRWHRALLHHKLLPKDWQDLAYQPLKNNYALGWSIESKYGRRFMTHSGFAPGFSNYVVRQEEDDLFIAVLENVTRGGETDAAIAQEIVSCLYKKNYLLPEDRNRPVVRQEEQTEPAAQARTPNKKAGAGHLRRYTGEFEINPALTLTFSIKNGELYGATQDGKTIRMIPESDKLFRAEGWNAEIEFMADRVGQVNKIVVHQQGELIPGVRAK